MIKMHIWTLIDYFVYYQLDRLCDSAGMFTAESLRSGIYRELVSPSIVQQRVIYTQITNPEII
jgi:hypothetical protein